MATILVRFNPPTPAAGDEVQVSIVVRHLMEPGTRKDANGETIPADYIDMMEISFDGEHLATISPKGGVSANPLFGFKMKASKAGDLVIKYTDMAGDSGEKVVALELAS